MEEIVEVSLLNEKLAVHYQDPEADKMCILNKMGSMSKGIYCFSLDLEYIVFAFSCTSSACHVVAFLKYLIPSLMLSSEPFFIVYMYIICL